MREGGSWIFLSHSSKDIDKVRLIRNEFERMGHNPLAFHLRCLSTDTEEGRKELDSLIKREIDAREWFVFCESPAASESPYVAEEHAYIVDSGKEMIWSLDMTQDIETILRKVRQICKDIEVYISYSCADMKAANLLADLFSEKDFSVWTPDSMLNPGMNWADEIGGAIQRCSYEGFIILLISENSMSSDWIEKEIAMITNYSGGDNIIPVILGDVTIPATETYQWLSPYRYVLPAKPSKEDFRILLEDIKKTVKAYTSGRRSR